MQRVIFGREVASAGSRRLTLGEPVRQIFKPIDQADTQCDAISLPPLAGEAMVGSSARPEDLRDLAGAVIPDQQATIGRLGDGQRM